MKIKRKSQTQRTNRFCQRVRGEPYPAGIYLLKVNKRLLKKSNSIQTLAKDIPEIKLSHKSLLSKTYRNSHSITRTLMVGIYCFTKNEVIHRCFSRNLIAPSAGSFTDSHFHVVSFAKHLLLYQNYFGMDYPLIFRSNPRQLFQFIHSYIHKILSSFFWVADVIIEAIQILF